MKKLLLSLTMLVLTSCSAKFSEPEVMIVDLKFLESTFFETNLETKIRIVNNDNNPFTITGSRHRIKINDIDLGNAVSNRRIVVPALGESTDLLTIRMSNLKLMTKLESLINSQNFSYQIDSLFYTTQGLGFGTISSSTKGEM